MLPIRLEASCSVDALLCLTLLQRRVISLLAVLPNDPELLAEMRALRRSNEDMHAALRAIASHAAKTSRLLDRAMPDGDAIATREATV